MPGGGDAATIGRLGDLDGGCSWRAAAATGGSLAVEDAFALRAQLAIARIQPALDPRRPFLDRARRALRDVRVEAGLDAALSEFRPVLDALARWPRLRDAPPGGGALPPADGGALCWSDRRVLRFSAAFSALWAVCHGPEDECGRRFARTAVELSHRGGIGGTPAARRDFFGTYL